MHTHNNIPQPIAQQILTLAVQTQTMLSSTILAITIPAPVYEQNITNTLHAITTVSPHTNTNVAYHVTYENTYHTLKNIAQCIYTLYTHMDTQTSPIHTSAFCTAVANTLTLYIQILKASMDAFLLQDATLAVHIIQHFNAPLQQTIQSLKHAQEQHTNITHNTHTIVTITQEILSNIYSINNHNAHNTI